MLPWVIIYNAVSLDGRITGFDADMELYYKLASKWDVDAVLMGSNTVLTGFGVKPGQTVEESEEALQPRIKEADDRPLLVVPDSKGQIRIWSELLEMPYIRDVLVLCSRSTPSEYLDFLEERYIDYLVVGYQHVDLETALEELNTKFGVKKIRIDSGGVLNGILLRTGLVDEVRLLIHPELAGGEVNNSIFQEGDLSDGNASIRLQLDNVEKIKDDIIYLKYKVFNEMLK